MAHISRKISARLARSWIAAAAITASAVLASAAALAADQPAKPTNSAKLAKPLKEAHDDLNAKKFPEAIAKLKEAEGTAGKTPFDQHLINDMLAYVYLKTNDFPDAAKAWEAEIEDGFTTGTELQQKVRGLCEVHYQLKNYDKAIEYGQRALKGGYGDDHIKTIVGQAYYLKGDWKGTLHFEEDIVSSTIKAGGTPAVEPLQLLLSSCVKLEDSACQTKALERMVTYYPKPDYWANLLLTLLKETASSDANTLEVYRLMLEVDVLKTADDYTEMAQLAMDAGTPGEAARVLQRGFDKNVFTEQRAKEKNQRLLEKAKQAAAHDQATLEKTAQEAEAATTGGKNGGMGLAYLSYGQYDKAVDQLSKAVRKGGLPHPAETQLLLGIAQLKAGHNDDAVKAFKAVKGDKVDKGDPVLERLATLWVLHARQK
jgi:tetratricopeptide (TPR) repeat protein